MSRQLPAKPNLEHLKKKAKELLGHARQGKSEAIERFRSLRLAGAPKLADAQHLVARDYGFATWAKLKAHISVLTKALTPPEQLSAAVRASDARAVARILESQPELKAHLNQPMHDYGGGMQPLLAAVQRTDRKTIDILLGAGADINIRSDWWSGGIGVLDECLPGLAAFLMERGAVLDAHSAARLGMLDKLKELVTADPGLANARGFNGQTPLHFASTVQIAEYLLERGADIDATDLQHESTPAQHMLRVIQARHYPRDRQDIARLLVARGCRTDIFMAAALGDLALVRRHLDADPNCIRMRVSEDFFPKRDPRSDGTIYIDSLGPLATPHSVARDFGHDEIFEFLMDHSPDDVKLAQACELGHESTFRTLLALHPDFVANLSPEDIRKLPKAAQSNNTNAVRLMLEAGWPVDAKGEMEMTSLQWASWHGNAAMVQEILRHHPQIELKDNEHGITAMGCALHGSENGWHRDTGDYVATVKALLDAGLKAPEGTDDLEASEPVRETLRAYAAHTVS